MLPRRILFLFLSQCYFRGYERHLCRGLILSDLPKDTRTQLQQRRNDASFYVYSLIFLIELIATLTTLVYYAADIPSCLLPLPVWTLTVCLLVSWISVPRIPPEPPHVKPTAYFVPDTSVDSSPTLFLLLLLLVPRIQAEATESNQLG